MTAFSDYGDYDALGLAELVRAGEVAPGDLLEGAIARIEALDPKFHALTQRLYDQARGEVAAGLPDGPFRGVPFLLKDLFAQYAGTPTIAGSRYLRDVKARHDTELVRRYRAAGLVVVGKTNVPELGILGQTEPELFGPSLNPWNPDHTPGGSSGGSGAAVAARLVPMAHASDGGGSIRIPASCCGLVGLKPTRGRNPLGPDAEEVWGGLMVEHAVTRSIRDTAALLDATAGPDPGAPYAAPPPLRPFADEVDADPGRVRVAFTTDSLLGETTHPDCVRAVEDAAALLEDLGHVVEEARPTLDRRRLARAYLTLVACHVAAEIDEAAPRVGRAPTPDDFEPTTWLLRSIGRALSAPEYLDALATARHVAREVAPFFERHDVFLTATMAYPPVRIGELAPNGLERATLRALRAAPVKPLLLRALDELGPQALEKTPNTMLFNMTGQPAMSLPLFWNDDRLPIGVQLAARHGDEAALLRLGAQLEKARPWAALRPPLGD